MTSPSTPQHTPPLPHYPSLTAIRRSYTLPTRLVDPTKTPPQVNHSPDAIETLLNLHFARVVAFDATTPSSRPSSSAGHNTEDITSITGSHQGLSWATPSERTLAAGPLRIYRVPNTGVSFLNSGTFLKPILQRSQCWCVDDDAKFVLRVREGSYYRIEVPSSNQEEKRQVEELKQTFDKLCRYEKTPCPFKKGYFEIEERPSTPGRKPSLASKEKAKKWRLNKVWEPEDADRRAEFQERNRRASEQWNSLLLKPTKRPEAPIRVGTEPTFVFPRTPPRRIPSSAVEQPSPLSLTMGVEPEQADSDSASIKQWEDEHLHNFSLSNRESGDPGKPEYNPVHLEVPFQEDHSVKISSESTNLHDDSIQVVPALDETLGSTNAQTQVEESHAESAQDLPWIVDAETASISSSHDSFYSAEDADDVEDIHPVVFKPQLPLFRTPLHSRHSSIITAVPDTPRAILIPPLMFQEPTTPTLTADSSSSEQTNVESTVVTPPIVRQRRPRARLQTATDASKHLSQRLSILSPTTSASIPISKAVIQKTYAMLIGPPTHIVSLMLSIAAQFLNRLPGRHRQKKIPGAWDTSDSDAIDDSDWDEADTEDDYGYPLQNISKFEDAKEVPSSAASSVAAGIGGREGENWEID